MPTDVGEETPSSTAASPGPRLARRFRGRVVAPDLVFFLADEDARCVRGRGWARLAPHLDGALDAVGLAAAAGTTVEEARAGLAALARQGLLVETGEGPAPQRPVGSRAPATLGPISIEVHGCDAPQRREIGIALSALARPTGPTTEGPFHLLVVDDYLEPELTRRVAGLPPGEPWLPVRASGERPSLGPLFGAGAAACPRCLQVALGRSRPVAALYYHLRREPAAPVSAARASWVLAEVVRRLADGSLVETLWVLDPATGDGEPHRLRREADCPSCRAISGAATPPALRARPILDRGDGGFRWQPAAATLRHLERTVDPLTGLVRSLRLRPDGGTGGPRVAVASYPHPLPPRSFDELRSRPRVAASGKGRTAEQALVGAVAEAIERSSGVFRGHEPRREATLAELGEAAIPAHEILLYSAAQLARGETAAAALAPERRAEWSQVHSLTDGRRRWLPTSLAWYAYSPPPGAWSHPADSNGCAAGRCPEEAVLQGLLELVERDAAAIWWYNAVARPRIGIPAGEPWVGVAGVCRRLGRELVLLDLTTDLEIPVVAAVALSEDLHDGPLFGFGAHLDPSLAVSRAVTELAQFLPGEDGAPRRDRRAASRAPAWLAAAARAPVTGALPPGAACADLAEAVGVVLARLARAGLDAFVLDQTRDPELLSVVRVLVPGLRPWTRRLAPGRLYDVPVALGWRPRPRSEDDMERRPLYA